MMTAEILKEQLVIAEAELDVAKAHVYRCDGAIQVLKHLISLAEHVQPEPEKVE